jgi:hypothetical protein
MQPFNILPRSVIDFVHKIFSSANDRVSRVVSIQPHTHEESLDHQLITEVDGHADTFFEDDKVSVALETHWLGGRRMYGRWEIADIAFLVLIRRFGELEARKVALLQTKRLYSREIAVSELDESDFTIGIGRLADKTDRLRSIVNQRAFSFDQDCVYGAMAAGGPQVKRIDQYSSEKDIPVYYAFYNPLTIPFASLYPLSSNCVISDKNNIGCRVLESAKVHSSLKNVPIGKTPAFNEVQIEKPIDQGDEDSLSGWRLENFVAYEVMKCHEGRLFGPKTDENLEGLLYRRSAPIQAAISITVDLGYERRAD